MGKEANWNRKRRRHRKKSWERKNASDRTRWIQTCIMYMTYTVFTFENRSPKISESMNFMELSLHIMV